MSNGEVGQDLIRSLHKLAREGEHPVATVKRLGRTLAQLTRDNLNYASSFREVVLTLGMDLRKDTKLAEVVERIHALKSTPQGTASTKATELQFRLSSVHKVLQARQEELQRAFDQAKGGGPYSENLLTLIADESTRNQELIKMCEGETVGQATMRILEDAPPSLGTDDLHNQWKR